MQQVELLPADIHAAVRSMETFVDCSEAQLMRICRLALEHARRRALEDIAVEKAMSHEVVSARSNDSLEAAEALLVHHHISGMPVVDDAQQVVGVVTEKDFLYRLEDQAAHTLGEQIKRFFGATSENRRKALAKTVGEIMTSPPITTTPTASLGRVASLLLERDINRLPVVDANGGLVGIVSRADLVRVLHSQDEAPSQGTEGAGDSETHP